MLKKRNLKKSEMREISRMNRWQLGTRLLSPLLDVLLWKRKREGGREKERENERERICVSERNLVRLGKNVNV